MDIPGVGINLRVKDPAGNTLSLLQPAPILEGSPS